MIEGMRGHCSQCKDESGGQSGGQRGIDAAGNANEGAQAQKLGQYKVIDQQCAKQNEAQFGHCRKPRLLHVHAGFRSAVRRQQEDIGISGTGSEHHAF